jgi:Ni2+-binding GTPase involved in maturation of urease and hydrogenase
MDSRIPVTVLTGFLGSGKTTLLNRILSENHGRRIAVIENEFGEVGVDNELVINADEEVFEMNNGCICCTVRGDLIRILGQLLKRRNRFDYILVETTGLADPGPVAQTFIVDDEVKEAFRLDGIVTLVDAHHVERHLDTSEECRKQVAFADVILLNKTDLCTDEAVASMERRLRAMNAAARIHRTERAVLPLEHLLHIHAFDLAAKLAQDADFLVEELPFEWGGLYRLPAGIGELVLQPGPDPTMDVVAFAGIPGSAGPDTLHEARIEALRRFSQPPVTLEPGGSLLLVPTATDWRSTPPAHRDSSCAWPSRRISCSTPSTGPRSSAPSWAASAAVRWSPPPRKILEARGTSMTLRCPASASRTWPNWMPSASTPGWASCCRPGERTSSAARAS